MKKILVVDDLSLDTMLTRMALARHQPPLKVSVAHDGEEAYRMLTEQAFDLLLLDIKMPRIDGFELLERLHAREREAAPAIIVSGTGLLSDRIRATELGALDYIQKAVDYSVFTEELLAAIRRHQL